MSSTRVILGCRFSTKCIKSKEENLAEKGGRIICRLFPELILDAFQ